MYLIWLSNMFTYNHKLGSCEKSTVLSFFVKFGFGSGLTRTPNLSRGAAFKARTLPITPRRRVNSGSAKIDSRLHSGWRWERGVCISAIFEELVAEKGLLSEIHSSGTDCWHGNNFNAWVAGTYAMILTPPAEEWRESISLGSIVVPSCNGTIKIGL